MTTKAKAQALLELSSDQFPNGDREVANEALRQALRLYAESGDPRGKDEIVGRYASELAALAQVSLPYLEPGTAVLGDMLFEAGRRLDDPDLARMALTQALAVHEAYGNVQGQAAALCRLCVLDLGSQAGPEPAMVERALELSAQGGAGATRAQALHLAARLAHRRKDRAQELGYLEEALRIAHDSGDVDSEVATLMGLANLAGGARDLDRARAHLLAALELVPRLEDQALGATVRVMLASSELAAGNLAAAEELNRNAVVATGLAPGAAAYREALADNLVRQGRVREAATEAVQQVQALEQERRRIGNARNQVRWYVANRHRYRDALDIAVRAGDGLAALEILEAQHAQALAGTLDADPAALASGLLEFDAPTRRLIRRIAELEESGNEVFTASATLSAEAAAQWNAYTAQALEEDHEALADKIGTALLRKAGAVEPIAKLRARLGASHALMLGLDWESDRAVVHAVWVPPLPGEPTVERVRLTEVQSRTLRAFATPGSVAGLLSEPQHAWQKRLALLLPDGLIALLNQEPGKHSLVVIPTGELWAVPFAALTVDDKTTGTPVPLVERATLTLAPSLAVAAMASTRKVRPVRNAVALLDLGLSGTGFEWKALDRNFKLTEVAPDFRELLLALDGKTKFELGVVSAHGDHVRGLVHALRLGEQRLFAAELLRHEIPLWWVMGACWSGGLDHEPGHEPMGLPTVALLRGARAVVAALHRVPDRATGRILADLYDGLAAGQSAPAALCAAQRKYLAANRGSTRLVDWAPLVAIGAPG